MYNGLQIPIMNSHHRLEIFRKGSARRLCTFILWIALYSSAFCGTANALNAFNVEQLCRAWKSTSIDLRHYPSGTLTSLTSGVQEMTCMIQLKAGVDSSVVLSLYKFSLEPHEELVIQDAQNFKLALIGEGDFSDEHHSFQSEGYLTLHYSKNRTSDGSVGGSRTKFQFTFTQVHRSPCAYEEFECRNLNCIPKSLLCDRHNSCGDNSDEKDCSPRNKLDEEIKPEIVVYRNTSGIFIISIIVCASLLGIIIIVFAAVLIRRSVLKKRKEAKTVALATVASSVPQQPPPPPPTTTVQPPVAPSMANRIRQSFRRTRNTQSVEQQREPDNYQVPSMYPEVPSAPEYHGGVDNPEFKADE